ncbi:ClpX, ATPase regulatory subunit [Terfezia boudieri ATCC MYA-4762]|uniref:ClpX, ATPase regulatory subunit n=1 Tax=Terfezia boudieri ATCC MYA-4762 TaxID=1051890 RepID=A0A3N4LXJ4_9PEZI|nr:ClpX, ATPase regulatory subunit [Terfezia boudieri ATCC MYA-4762]
MPLILHAPPVLLRCTSSLPRRWLSTFNSSSSDFSFTSGYSSAIDTNTTIKGPLGDASLHGAHRLTPRALKEHLDKFVVGQRRAKRVLSTSVYYHYRRIQQVRQRQEEEEELTRVARAMDVHSLEDEFPGQQQTMHYQPDYGRDEFLPIHDHSPLTLEKSNVLCLGPTGVGKTLMIRTLARVLEVPFSMSDCTPFTQAGYVGEDADVCIHRLLAASNWDVRRAETGIICLDEFDKIAKPKSTHGSKDISGEGVQQALLKIIEGTTLQVSAKPERRPPSGLPGGSTVAGPGGPGGANKGEIFTVDTSNILFIFTGAFIGLDKVIMDRVSKGSIGFNAHVRTNGVALEDEKFRGYTPFFTPNEGEGGKKRKFNPLELAEPGDLINFGLIPEIVGRIPVLTAVEKLDEEMLVRVLTEPRNCLIKQYEQLFLMSGIELRFTSGALWEIAKAAMKMETGARGLRTVLERLLTDAMFEAPGSSIKYVLVTEAVAQKKQPPLYFGRGQKHQFHGAISEEEATWASYHGQMPEEKPVNRSYEDYKEKGKAAGFT